MEYIFLVRERHLSKKEEIIMKTHLWVKWNRDSRACDHIHISPTANIINSNTSHHRKERPFFYYYSRFLRSLLGTIFELHRHIKAKQHCTDHRLLWPHYTHFCWQYSHLLPIYFPSTSHLLPIYFPSTSHLLPHLHPHQARSVRTFFLMSFWELIKACVHILASLRKIE